MHLLCLAFIKVIRELIRFFVVVESSRVLRGFKFKINRIVIFLKPSRLSCFKTKQVFILFKKCQVIILCL